MPFIFSGHKLKPLRLPLEHICLFILNPLNSRNFTAKVRQPWRNYVNNRTNIWLLERLLVLIIQTFDFHNWLLVKPKIFVLGDKNDFWG